MLQNKGKRQGKGHICCALTHSKGLHGLQAPSMCSHLAIVELTVMVLLLLMHMRLCCCHDGIVALIMIVLLPLLMHLAEKVADMSATCCHDSQMSAHFSQMPPSRRDNLDPNTIFCVGVW
jgi:hypothetical protein